LSESELLEIADRVIAGASGDEQVEAYVSRSRTTTARARKGEVESLEQATAGGVGVRVIKDGKQGFAYAGTLDADELRGLLDEARDNATYSSPDDGNALAAPDGVSSPELDRWDDAIATFEPARAVDLALLLERAALAADPRVAGVSTAEMDASVGERAMATTTGIRIADRSASCGVMAEALAVADGERYEAYAWQRSRSLEDLDVERIGRDAGEQAAGRLGATQPQSRRTTVVLDQRVAASLVGLIGSTLVGEAVLKGRSLFADRIGEQVAATSFTLVDDATDARSIAAGNYDGEGLASRRNVLIEDGVLRMFLHHTWSARKAGASSTASASRGYASTPHASARALQVAPGSAGSRDDLLRAVGDGVYVQSVAGLHSGVNPISGDFSVGMTGRAIRGGQLAEPLREATIASTLQRLLLDIVAIGSDIDWQHGGTVAPLLAIDGVSLSGS
jgi:PmbA protein